MISKEASLLLSRHPCFPQVAKVCMGTMSGEGGTHPDYDDDVGGWVGTLSPYYDDRGRSPPGYDNIHDDSS